MIVSQTAATTRAFADEGAYEVDVNRDFLGVGAGNVVAGLIGAFPVNASPPRTAAVVSASGRTQVAGLAAAGALVLLIPAVALLEDLPLATLAAILIFIATRILHIHDLVDIARYDRFEFGLALITLLTVALVGVEQGITVAVALAILDRTRLSARPHLHVLGRIPSTTSWAPLGGTEHAIEVPGVLVVLFATPLWYANASHFRTDLTAAVDRAGHSLRLIVLDAMGMTDLDYTGACALRQMLDRLDPVACPSRWQEPITRSAPAWREAACLRGSARTTCSPPSAKQLTLCTPTNPRVTATQPGRQARRCKAGGRRDGCIRPSSRVRAAHVQPRVATIWFEVPAARAATHRRRRPAAGSPAGPSPRERQNGVADKVADTTPPQPATKEENIRAESEAGDPSMPTMLLRARTTVSLAASQ